MTPELLQVHRKIGSRRATFGASVPRALRGEGGSKARGYLCGPFFGVRRLIETFVRNDQEALSSAEHGTADSDAPDLDEEDSRFVEVDEVFWATLSHAADIGGVTQRTLQNWYLSGVIAAPARDRTTSGRTSPAVFSPDETMVLRLLGMKNKEFAGLLGLQESQFRGLQASLSPTLGKASSPEFRSMAIRYAGHRWRISGDMYKLRGAP